VNGSAHVILEYMLGAAFAARRRRRRVGGTCLVLALLVHKLSLLALLRNTQWHAFGAARLLRAPAAASLRAVLALLPLLARTRRLLTLLLLPRVLLTRVLSTFSSFSLVCARVCATADTHARACVSSTHSN